MSAPLVSYKDFIKNASDKIQARKQLRKWILSQQMNCSEASRSLMCSWRTIKKLITDDNLDYESRKAPINCPHKLDAQIELAIVDYHNKSGYGAAMLQLNYDIKHSIGAIHRVLKANGLVNKTPRKHVKKKQVKSIRNTLKAFEMWQLDTKYLTDIPNLIAPIYQGNCPMYEYTLRDVVTGTTFLGYGMKERSVNDTCTFVSLCLYHMKLHGIDTHYVTIQSDNGPEIIGSFYKLGRYEIEKVVEDEYHARFKTIPARQPTWNSHVETFHGRVERECYDRIKLDSLQSFIDQTREFTRGWNTSRKSLRFRKTPQRIAQEYGFQLNASFYDLPNLIYDKLSNMHIVSNSPMHYLPVKVKNPTKPINPANCGVFFFFELVLKIMAQLEQLYQVCSLHYVQREG